MKISYLSNTTNDSKVFFKREGHREKDGDILL